MLFVDAHVHIYDCYDLADMFDAAFYNFSNQAEHLGRNDDFSGILLLTESREHHFFDRLSGSESTRAGEHLNIGSWRAAKTSEKDSLLLTGSDGEKLVIIAGRQLVSSEGLEVLALATASDLEEDLPVSELIEYVLGAGGVPVLPWAFGKWFGERGKILQQLISPSKIPEFYLGDNGGRPSLFPYPGQLQVAAQKKWQILSGTDPLPIAGDETRVGSFGVYVDSDLNDLEPARQLRKLLSDKDLSFVPYGTSMNIFRFMRNQLTLRGL